MSKSQDVNTRSGEGCIVGVGVYSSRPEFLDSIYRGYIWLLVSVDLDLKIAHQ